YLLREYLEEKLKSMTWQGGKNMWDFYWAYWRPFGEMLTDMERAGFYVRKSDYLPELEKQALADSEKQVEKFKNWVKNAASDAAKHMNINSAAQKQQFFFGAKG